MSEGSDSVVNSVLGDEHQRFGEMLSSMLFALQNMRSSAISPEAIDVLRERAEAHFRVEERLVKDFDEQSLVLLRRAHNDLSAILSQVKACQDAGDDDEGKRLLAVFADELARHDEEIDTPLFRLMVSQGLTAVPARPSSPAADQ